MLAWWYSLDILGQVLATVAIAATVILAIQSILLLFGFGFGSDGDADCIDCSHDEDFDIHDGHDHDVDTTGLSLFTIRGLVAFFCVGGWTGLALLPYMNDVLALILAFAAGFLALLGVALLMKYAYSLQDKGNLELNNVIGKSGKVYIPIPENEKGYGKITLLMQERLVELDALTKQSRQLATNELVRVCGVVDGSTVLVEPLEEKQKNQGGISKWIQ